MKINFESEPIYGDKYIKIKIKKYADCKITNFHNRKMSKEKVPCKCLSIIMLNSVIKTNDDDDSNDDETKSDNDNDNHKYDE